MSFNRQDVETPVVVEDAKKSDKGGAMKKAKKLGSADMRVSFPKETSVPASKNAAKKVAIKKQKLS